MATAAMAAMAASVVFARITEVASRDLLNFLPATGRTYLLSSTTSVNHRGPPSLTRAELGTNGLTGWDHACLEMFRFPEFTQRTKRSKSVQCDFIYDHLC
ncbi:MAG TPA: hypothetical protein VJY33_20370 [Isosphaeraceae bacterium]|nr:hypothetical protein [Isosphaeraceae bacterium]